MIPSTLLTGFHMHTSREVIQSLLQAPRGARSSSPNGNVKPAIADRVPTIPGFDYKGISIPPFPAASDDSQALFKTEAE